MTRHERALRRVARQYGWRLERTNSDQWRLRHPTGAIVIASFTPATASTPGDRGNLRVVEGCLRRAERGTHAPEGA